MQRGTWRQFNGARDTLYSLLPHFSYTSLTSILFCGTDSNRGLYLRYTGWRTLISTSEFSLPNM
jgi:hypothetical protein